MKPCSVAHMPGAAASVEFAVKDWFGYEYVPHVPKASAKSGLFLLSQLSFLIDFTVFQEFEVAGNHHKLHRRRPTYQVVFGNVTMFWVLGSTYPGTGIE